MCLGGAVLRGVNCLLLAATTQSNKHRKRGVQSNKKNHQNIHNNKQAGPRVLPAARRGQAPLARHLRGRPAGQPRHV
jgi:hypothetical protein